MDPARVFLSGLIIGMTLTLVIIKAEQWYTERRRRR